MICTLSKHEAERLGFTDSLMLDHEGNIAEATGANIFFKDKNNEFHTPIPDSFLDGITRQGTIVGVDLVEVAPDYDLSGSTATLAAQLLLNLIGRIAETRGRPVGY